MGAPVPGPDRVERMTALLSVGERDPTFSLCVATAQAIGVTGAGVVLVSRGRMLGNVCASNAMIEAVEELQYTLGEGPGVDAVRIRAPVSEPDLGNPESDVWPSFRAGASAAGARAAFGFPLMIQKVCFGAVDLYNDEPGALSDDQLADSVAAAHVASRAVLGWQAFAGDGSLAWQLEQVPGQRASVHQAAGIISVQAAVSVAHAAIMLRAYSFAEDRAISTVAADVVSGILRFDGSTPDE